MLSKIINLITTSVTPPSSTTTKENTIMLQDLNFNDRESYLAWRKEWFVAYKEAIAAVRAGKQAFKEEQRKITVQVKEYSYGKEYIAMYGESRLRWSCTDYYSWFSNRPKLVAEVEKLVNLRQQAREKSAIQREEMLRAKGIIS